MRPSSYVYLAAIAVLLIFSTFFSASDMAFSVAPKRKLEREAKAGDKRSARALRFAAGYEETITTLLFGNCLVNILASSLGTVFALNLAFDNGFDENLTSTIVSASMLLIILTFGEIVPKAIARNRSYSVSRFAAPAVSLSQIIFFPVVKVTTAFAKLLTKPIIERHEVDESVSDEELSLMVEELEEGDVIDEDSSELIANSIEFKDTCAYQIMTPRVKMEGIEWGTNLAKYISSNGSFQHSRIPVYKGDKDHVVGYISTKALLRQMLSESKPSIEKLLLPITPVPRTMEISSVLALMKKTRHHIVLVVDEYGGTEGILTLEDILEELVGDMWDESEQVKPDIIKGKARNHYLALGSANIEDVFDYFDLDDDILDQDYSTLSGWINDKLGRFAEEGDHFQVGKYDFVVLKVDQFTTQEVEIIYHPRRKISED